ncbi:uncharacterized protein HKW66_Vig0077750 [Vigna angularis]|uniref:Uncharacterized protein n=1 Tax=Phaseolus angularis TaxID=3914 RepID=A0A8T0K536_PHAAN|nr:uncharacterized protein HKW66_Vig0077750 [Vigna angularis]
MSAYHDMLTSRPCTLACFQSINNIAKELRGKASHTAYYSLGGGVVDEAREREGAEALDFGAVVFVEFFQFVAALDNGFGSRGSVGALGSDGIDDLLPVGGFEVGAAEGGPLVVVGVDEGGGFLRGPAWRGRQREEVEGGAARVRRRPSSLVNRDHKNIPHVEASMDARRHFISSFSNLGMPSLFGTYVSTPPSAHAVREPYDNSFYFIESQNEIGTSFAAYGGDEGEEHIEAQPSQKEPPRPL